MNFAPLWPEIKESLKAELPSGAFKLWIAPLSAVVDDGERLVLGCPNQFARRWLNEHYLGALRALLPQPAGPVVELVVAPPAPAEPSALEIPEVQSLKERQPDLPYQPGRLLTAEQEFNPAYTFESFVAGPNSAFALEAALALARGTDLGHKALFLHSATGLGKSHISQALGWAIVKNRPEERVLYLTAEDFTNQMVAAIRGQSVDEFKNRFRRRCTTLILEEVSFLSGKDRTQAELALTLDAILDKGRKVVFTSPRLPQEIPSLKPEMRSRLSQGVIATIAPPDLDTRIKILRDKARRRNLCLPESVAETLARAITQDVRRLESALLCLAAKSQLLKEPVSQELAREVLGAACGPARRPSLEAVLDLVCSTYQLTRPELLSRSRLKKVAKARMLAMYLSRIHTGLPLTEISQAFGRRHSTIIYAQDQVEKAIHRQDRLGREAEFLADKLVG